MANDDPFLFYSALYDRPVLDPDGNAVGRLDDLAVTLAETFPAVTALLIRRGRVESFRLTARWRDVESLEPAAVRLRVPVERLVPGRRLPSEVVRRTRACPVQREEAHDAGRRRRAGARADPPRHGAAGRVAGALRRGAPGGAPAPAPRRRRGPAAVAARPRPGGADPRDVGRRAALVDAAAPARRRCRRRTGGAPGRARGAARPPGRADAQGGGGAPRLCRGRPGRTHGT